MSPEVAYQKARRDAARERGECLQCCRRPVEEGKSRCRHCLDVNAHAHKDRSERTAREQAARVWCDECIACGFHRADCPTLRERVA
jgi:hypothetical protein